MGCNSPANLVDQRLVLGLLSRQADDLGFFRRAVFRQRTLRFFVLVDMRLFVRSSVVIVVIWLRRSRIRNESRRSDKSSDRSFAASCVARQDLTTESIDERRRLSWLAHCRRCQRWLIFVVVFEQACERRRSRDGTWHASQSCPRLATEREGRVRIAVFERVAEMLFRRRIERSGEQRRR